MGRLQLADPIDACETIHQKDDDFSQRSVMVAVRGNCPFVVKAHYAQLAGAKLLLIVHSTYENVQNHLMVDSMGQGFYINFIFC